MENDWLQKKDGDLATTIVKAERRRKFFNVFDLSYPGPGFLFVRHRCLDRAVLYSFLHQSVVQLIYRLAGCGRVIVGHGLDLRDPVVQLVDSSFCHLASLFVLPMFDGKRLNRNLSGELNTTALINNQCASGFAL